MKNHFHPLKKVGIIGKKLNPDQRKKHIITKKIVSILEKKFDILTDEYIAESINNKNRARKKSRQEIIEKTDFIVTIGGDGTVLKAARTAVEKNFKILPINTGNVGFLTEIFPAELPKAIKNIQKSDYTLDSRTLLSVRVKRKKKEIYKGFALNDSVINQGPFARLLTLSIQVDSQKAFRLRADGIIVATPTGSTGHSLSAGGPVIHPQLDAFVINALCPVLLSLRPIVIPDSSKIIIKIEEKTGLKTDVRLTLDGQESIPVEHGDEILIEKGSHQIEFIRFPGRTHYQMVEEKLRWSERSF